LVLVVQELLHLRLVLTAIQVFTEWFLLAVVRVDKITQTAVLVVVQQLQLVALQQFLIQAHLLQPQVESDMLLVLVLAVMVQQEFQLAVVVVQQQQLEL
jgi:hypothetical protein